MSLNLTFSAKEKDISKEKLVINWQNFARVRPQLKFAFHNKALIITCGCDYEMQLRKKSSEQACF